MTSGVCAFVGKRKTSAPLKYQNPSRTEGRLAVDCVFRSFHPASPNQTSQAFQFKPAAKSGPFRRPIPVQFDGVKARDTRNAMQSADGAGQWVGAGAQFPAPDCDNNISPQPARSRQVARLAIATAGRDSERWNSVFRLGRLPLSRASGRGLGRGRWQERGGPDLVENGLHRFQDCVVPKAQHDEAAYRSGGRTPKHERARGIADG